MITMGIWIGILLAILQFHYEVSSSCNEAVCASIVSKCMLTQSCKCDLKNCTCCRDCYNCLDELYDECCSCVEICPKSNHSSVPLSKNSHVGDIHECWPQVFNALTEEPDKHLRWVAYSFPVHQDTHIYSPKLDKEIKFIAVSSPSQDITKFEEENINCTVAFMSECLPWNKCKKSCASMGACRYRWFHDGCCECIGDTCLNYGISVNKCLKCPPALEDLDDVDDDFHEIESNETGEGSMKSEVKEDPHYGDPKKTEV